MNKIIHLKNFQNHHKKSKMLFLSIFIGALVGVILWNFFVENVANLDVKIPPSQNITFNHQPPMPMTTAQVANEFENAENKPMLIYIYTTWCKICTKNFPVINEIAREFQNTDLKVFALAIDRNLDAESLQEYLNGFGNVYFSPKFLAFKEGFLDLLRKKNIQYGNQIPFTVLISSNGEIVTKFVGSKSKNYLRKKIVSELYVKQD